MNEVRRHGSGTIEPDRYSTFTTHHLCVVVNPRREPTVLDTNETAGMRGVFGSGARLTDAGLAVDGFGYGIFAR